MIPCRRAGEKSKDNLLIRSHRVALYSKRQKMDGVPSYFTLDACRHGGMTELEEVELTEGQGRALSGHKTSQAYRGYAKEAFERALSATRKCHTHRLANAQSTSVQNEGRISVQNEAEEQKASDAK
jgi:hypothetical protein